MSSENLTPKERYATACKEHTEIPIFYHPWWLDIMCGSSNWTALVTYGHNKRVDAIWPIPISKFYGQKITRHPPLTPFLGMIIFIPKDIDKTTSRQKFRQKVAESLIDQFKELGLSYFNQHFSEDNNDLQNLFWNGFKQQSYSRFVINSIRQDNLLNTFDGDIRTNIKKAKEIVKCETATTCPELFQILSQSFKSSSKSIPYTQTTLETLLEKIIEETSSKLIVAKTNTETIGACLILIDNNTAYLNCLGVKSDFRNSGISSLLIWEGMQFASGHVDRFDFSGSMIPNIANFFRGFGGDKISYNNVKWYKNSLFKIIHQSFNG